MIKVLIMHGDYSTLLLPLARGRQLSPVPRNSIPEDYVSVGVAGLIDGVLYWLYGDDDRCLWLMGEAIAPILITAHTHVKLSADAGNRRLILRDGEQMVLDLTYTPPPADPLGMHDFSAASMDTERGDFGLLVYNRLSNPEVKEQWWK